MKGHRKSMIFFCERGDEMSILDTIKKVMPYLKTDSGYVLCRLSSQAVEMDDGLTLEQKVTSLNSLIESKVDTSSVVNNALTTEEGFVLDARQGKELDDKITELNGNLDTNITTSETETHELYENQRIYTKYVDCKSLPNAGNKTYSLDIPSGFAWVDLSNSYVYSNASSLRTIFPLNYYNEKTGSNITFSLSENDKTITFGTADDWSAYNAFIVVKYYKY